MFSTSIHGVKRFSASTVAAPGNECATHLTIDFDACSLGETATVSGSITFYISDRDLTERLIKVINDTVRAHKVRKVA